MQALKKRHAILERMLLLPPQHLEHVDNYIHKGDLPDITYISPWQSGTSYKHMFALCSCFCNIFECKYSFIVLALMSHFT